MSLFVIGSSNTDLVLYMNHIPKIGETVVGAQSTVIFGGKGANQAVSSKRAGADTKFITQLGNDGFGDELKKHFKKENLPGEYILTDKFKPSGVAHIFVSKKGENSIAVASGSNGTLSFKKIEPFLSEIEKAKLVLIQFEIPFDTVKKIINFCNHKKIKLIVNPAPALELSENILKNIWMITPNENESEILTNIRVTDQESAVLAGQKIVSKGVQNCIITLGENGSVWCTKKSTYIFKVPKINAIDTTAAGDVFNGYLAQGIINDLSLTEAILFSHAASCLSVTVKGAQTSIPSKEDTISFLKKNKGFTFKKIK